MRNHVLRCLPVLILLAVGLLAQATPQASDRPAAARQPRSPQPSIVRAAGIAATNAPPIELVGSFGGALTTFAISGTLAYVGEGAGLTVLDVGNPDLPVRLARLPLPGAQIIRLSGNAAYVVAGNQLTVVDVTVPNTPLVVGSYSLLVSPNDLQVVGKLAYLAYGNGPRYFGTDPGGGLEIVDLGDPAHPTLRGSYWANSWAGSVAIVNGTVYIATISGLQVVDVRNPAQPVLRSTYITEHYQASYIQIEHELAYVVFFWRRRRSTPLSS